MRTYLNFHHIENSNKIVDILEKQSITFYNFVKKYSEYSKLSKKEKELLIGNSLKTHDKFTPFFQFSGSQTQGKLMVADGGGDDGLRSYAVAIQGCQDTYRTTFRSIWATADVVMIGTSFETAGLGSLATFTAACVATYFADQERGNCMTLAANNFYLTL